MHTNIWQTKEISEKSTHTHTHTLMFAVTFWTAGSSSGMFTPPQQSFLSFFPSSSLQVHPIFSPLLTLCSFCPSPHPPPGSFQARPAVAMATLQKPQRPFPQPPSMGGGLSPWMTREEKMREGGQEGAGPEDRLNNVNVWKISLTLKFLDLSTKHRCESH